MVSLRHLGWNAWIQLRYAWRPESSGGTFLRFGLVGSVGLCWDTATVYALRGVIGLYAAGAAGFVLAATSNWALNRVWTFKRSEHALMHVQWARFLAINLVGFVFNRGVFFILVAETILCRRVPLLAIIAGTFSGLFFNYFLSKRFVFR
jgi:putative flippase GtrA